MTRGSEAIISKGTSPQRLPAHWAGRSASFLMDSKMPGMWRGQWVSLILSLPG